MALPKTSTMTVTEFDAWAIQPENSDKRLEYINGEVVELVTQSDASKIAMKFGVRIGIYLENNDIGELTGADGGYIVMGERYILDVAFIRYDRQAHLPAAYYPVAPDLAVEVISNKSNQQEMSTLRKKIGSYIAAGTIVWVVDPELQTIEVYTPGQKTITLNTEDTLTGGDTLPGFELAVKDIFPPAKTNEQE